MEHFDTDKIVYLENEDVGPNGEISQQATKGKYTVIMLQSLFCGFCTRMKPAFQSFALNNPQVSSATIQIDGNASEKKLGQRVSKWVPGFQGVPTVIINDPSGKFIAVHNGGRKEVDLVEFANRYTR